jgi:D-alanine-D-alanine ligase
MRLDAKGGLHILEINSLPSLGARGSYVYAAEKVGLDFTKLVSRLVEVASARYFGTPSPPQMTTRSKDHKRALFTFLTERRDIMERRLSEWTGKTSRTYDRLGLERITKDLEHILTEIKMNLVPDFSDSRSVYTWETRKGMKGGTLLVFHIDVPVSRVFPVTGFRREPEWLYGDGIGTSRASLVIAEFTLRALRHLRLLRSRRIGVLYYLDEGEDCRYSSEIIRKAMSSVKRVIVLRPGGIGNTFYVQRRGQRRYRMIVEGEPSRPGKASKRPEVLLWLARRLEDISKLNSRKNRISASIKHLRTEDFPMLLPHRIVAVMMITYADQATAEATVKSIRDILGRGGPKWKLELISDRPPMQERRANKRFVSDLMEAAREWDIPLKSDSSVWPSVAGLAPKSTGIVCGIGSIARNLYTPDESVQRISLMQRTLLLSGFLLREDRRK